MENMNNITVSVVVPSFNAETTIARCIESIIGQSYKNFELIVVDDGSTDSTAKIVSYYEKIDKRISIIHKHNGGLTSARKAGYLVSKGSYICFLDADDYVEDNYLSVMVDKMDDSTDIVIASYYVENFGNFSEKLFDETEIEAKEFTSKFILPSICYLQKIDQVQYPDFVWLRLYRKDIISDNCFVSERICYTEDLFFQFNALKLSRKVKIISTPLYHYVLTEQSLTQKYRSNKREMLANRYALVEEFCNTNSITVEQKRLNGLKLISIIGNVYNYRLLNDRLQFIQECKHISVDYDVVFKSSVVKDIPFVSKKQLLIFLLMKFRLYAIIYIILR